MNKAMFILFVKDQGISKAFYKTVLDTEAVLDVPGMTEFDLYDGTILGLMPEDGIVRILEGKIPHPKAANGVARSELYLFVDNPQNYYDRLVEAGGIGISKAEIRSWGDEVTYGLDPDGHILAFAKRVSE